MAKQLDCCIFPPKIVLKHSCLFPTLSFQGHSMPAKERLLPPVTLPHFGLKAVPAFTSSPLQSPFRLQPALASLLAPLVGSLGPALVLRAWVALVLVLARLFHGMPLLMLLDKRKMTLISLKRSHVPQLALLDQLLLAHSLRGRDSSMPKAKNKEDPPTVVHPGLSSASP